jgi:Tfp pilus assembly protein PilF
VNADVPDAYYSLGYVYHAIGEIDSAQIYVGQAVKKDPEYPEANFSLGFIFMQQNETDSARVYFEKYLTLPNADVQLKERVQGMLDSLSSI